MCPRRVPASPAALVCAGLALALLGAGACRAQGTRADYERAAGLRARVQGLVTRDRISPVWLDDHRFWYRLALPGGKQETWLVDARAGTKTPYTPEPGTAGAPLPAVPFGRAFRSRDGGEETELVFENRTAEVIRLLWVPAEGGEREYAALEPGATHRQHTFAGHAWVARSREGRVLGAWIAPAGGGRVVIDGTALASPRQERAAAPPGRSPDGRWTAFLRNDNLWLRSGDGGAERALTTDGSPARRLEGPLAWSPDGRKLVAFRTVPAQTRSVHLIESAPRDQLQPRLRTLDYLKPGDRIALPRPCLFSVEDGREIPIPNDLMANPWSLTRVRWDPDSSRFTLLYNQRGHQVLRLLAVDAATGSVRVLIEETSPTFVDYAHKLYLHYLDRTRELVWMSERDGWNHLYLIDAHSGRVKRQVTRGQWAVRRVERVDEEKRQAWFWAGGVHPQEEPYHLHLCRTDLDGSGFVDLTPGDGTHTVQFSPSGDTLIDTWSRVDQPPITELRRASDGGLVLEVERADASELLKTGWRFPERFVAPGRDGKTPIHGVIWRPTNFRAGEKYPVIENIYAGPQGAFVPKSFGAYHSQRYLAELGFIVVQIDGMGTNWRGKAFHDVCWKNLADAGFPDRKLWLQAAARKHPEMDLTRVGIYGGSAGGQNALAGLLHHGDLYKVGVSDCGCHDNRMDKVWWNELWMGWPVGPEYAASSNVTHAAKLQGKVLLVVGELDTNVDPASTMQVVDALVRANRDFELLIIPGAGHGACETPYGVRRRADFFVRHLLGVEPRR